MHFQVSIVFVFAVSERLVSVVRCVKRKVIASMVSMVMPMDVCIPAILISHQNILHALFLPLRY